MPQEELRKGKGPTFCTMQNEAFVSCGLLSTLHQKNLVVLGWTKFRVLTETPPNLTEVHGDSMDLRIGRIRARIFMCIRFESIKHLIKGVITLQRGYRANFWRCSPGGATSWSTPPKLSQIVKDSGPVFFSARVFECFCWTDTADGKTCGTHHAGGRITVRSPTTGIL